MNNQNKITTAKRGPMKRPSFAYEIKLAASDDHDLSNRIEYPYEFP